MDQETYLKELAKHAQRNTTNPRGDQDLNQKQVQISMHKETKMEEMDPASLELCRQIMEIDPTSLELYRQMMADRYHGSNTEE